MAYARRIYIGKQDYTTRVDQCSFDWIKEGGCNTCNLVIAQAAFDDYLGIEIGEIIDIRYDTSTSTRWFYGSVAEVTTDINGGLSISGVGTKATLGEIFPLGRYGTKVSMGTPSGLAALASEVGGQLAAATYTYCVSAVDDTGETLCSSTVTGTVVGSTGKVDLSWTNLTLANGYRIYRGTANPWVYWETSENAFTDDGTSSGTSIAALPASDTSSSPNIVSAYLDDIVDDLLDRYLPSDLGTGTLTGGDDFQIDDYDLKEGEASLLDVLSALAEIGGPEIAWGVDQNGDVYFKDEATSPTFTLRVGRDGQTANVVTATTRRRSRDGVTAVRIEGNDELKDPQREIEIQDRIGDSDDWPDTQATAGKEWWKGGANYKFTSKVTATQATIGETSASLTQAYAGAQSFVELVPEIITLKRMALSWNGASYDIEPPFTEAIIAKHLQRINDRINYIRTLRNATVGDFENMTRRNNVVRYLPGVKTPALAKIAASNFTAKYKAVPDQWTITVEGLDTLLVPGVDLIRFYTQSGKSYDLSIQSVSYTFESTVVAQLQCGDADFSEEKEEIEQKKVVQKIVHKRTPLNVWTPYRSE